MSAPTDTAGGELRARNRRLLLLVAAALVLRLAAMVALGTPDKARSGDAWDWGHESACLAQSLVEGGPYGDPWNKDTGPSAWLTPPYPALLAILWQAFGGVSPALATALFALQSLLSALTCALIVLAGIELGRPRAGWLGGWLFALYPPSIWNAVDTVWDTTLVAFGVALFAVLFLQALRSGGLGPFALAGLIYGALLFTNPAPVTLAPGALLAIALTRRGGFALRALAFGLPALLVCLPWMVRNSLVIESFSLRPNYGVEMRLGNNPTATGRPIPMQYHPSHVQEELDLYRKLGETAYAENCRQRAFDWIGAHPGTFAALTLKRVQFFWLGDLPTNDTRRETGLEARADWKAWIKFLAFGLAGAGALAALLALDVGRPERVFLTLALLLYGVPYFVTHVSERYRFPIDPLIVLLDAWLVLRIARAKGPAP